MTTEEAIKHLKLYVGNDCYTTKMQTACKMAITALRAQQKAEQQGPCSKCGYGGQHLDAPPCTTCEVENSTPLTLDELREMDGDPVWVTPGNFWALVRVVDKLVILVASDGERAYAGAWIKLMGPIYRRKPEEGAKIGVAKDKDVPTKFAIMRR